jgi:energy-coupling factor transporter ATP-binding protein EcfA2
MNPKPKTQENKIMSTSKVSHWETLGLSALRFAWFTVQEFYLGIRYDKIDHRKYTLPGAVLAGALVINADVLASWLTGYEWMILSYKLKGFVVYSSLASGWIYWPVERAFARTKMLARLKEAFVYCGLTANRKFPAFIEDKPIDDHVRRLRLFTQGIPKQKFIEQKESLEAMLNISVVKIDNEAGDKGRINILYAMRPLQTEAILENQRAYRGGDIPIGISYEGPVWLNLPEIAHLLVAGQTGGGKSNFEKMITTTLVENNPEADVFFLDFKGGMELADLTNRLGSENKNFYKYENSRACAEFLATLGENIEERLQAIASAGVASLEAYQKNPVTSAVKDSTSLDEITLASKRKKTFRRTYIVIDEIAQLYTRDLTVDKSTVEKAKAAVNRIARQGRAAGIHLVIATQKPDAQSFDQTVKSNLPAVLCFPMPSQVASVSAIGSKRAFDLNPEIKGRAVFKHGPTLLEVQTYLFQ